MKWNVEPALVPEAVRQLLLTLVLFGIVHWTDQQMAAVLMVVSAGLAVFTRQTSVPTSVVHAAGTTSGELKATAKANAATEQAAVDLAANTADANKPPTP